MIVYLLAVADQVRMLFGMLGSTLLVAGTIGTVVGTIENLPRVRNTAIAGLIVGFVFVLGASLIPDQDGLREAERYLKCGPGSCK